MISEHVENATHDISGPELLSFADMAAQLSTTLGREIRYVPIGNDAFRESMRGAGVPPWYVDAVGDLFQLIAKGDSAVTTPTYRNVTGVDPVSLADYLERAKAAFVS